MTPFLFIIALSLSSLSLKAETNNVQLCTLSTGTESIIKKHLKHTEELLEKTESMSKIDRLEDHIAFLSRSETSYDPDLQQKLSALRTQLSEEYYTVYTQSLKILSDACTQIKNETNATPVVVSAYAQKYALQRIIKFFEEYFNNIRHYGHFIASAQQYKMSHEWHQRRTTLSKDTENDLRTCLEKFEKDAGKGEAHTLIPSHLRPLLIAAYKEFCAKKILYSDENHHDYFKHQDMVNNIKRYLKKDYNRSQVLLRTLHGHCELLTKEGRNLLSKQPIVVEKYAREFGLQHALFFTQEALSIIKAYGDYRLTFEQYVEHYGKKLFYV